MKEAQTFIDAIHQSSIPTELIEVAEEALTDEMQEEMTSTEIVEWYIVRLTEQLENPERKYWYENRYHFAHILLMLIKDYYND